MKKKKINWKKLLLFTGANIVILFIILCLLSGAPKLVKFNSAKLIRKTGDSLEIVMKITFENPNLFSISGKEVIISSSTSSGLIGIGKIGKFTIGPKTSDSITVIMMLNSDQLMKAYTSNADNFESTITVKGSFSPLFFVTEVNIESAIPKKQINALILSSFFSDNDISFDSLNYRPISPVESKMNFNVKLKNTFNFAFTVKSIDLNVLPSANSQTVIGNWSIEKEAVMEPKKEVHLNGVLRVHHIAIMMAGLEKGGKELNSAYISGTATLVLDSEIINVPFGFGVTADMTQLKIDQGHN